MIGRIRHRLRTRLSEYPAVYLPLARRKYPGPSPEVVGPDTQLVIDGYTRSASTFAVYALQLAQPVPVRLAHHLHAPAQLIAAARAGIPALLLVREPRGAVLSQLVREPDVALRDALAAYVRYHECLRGYLDRLVVGRFEEVTTNPGAVLARVNARFGLALALPPADEQFRQRCLGMIEHRGALSPTLLGFESGLVSAEEAEHYVASRPDGRDRQWVPSPERQAAKAALAAEWERPGLAALRARAAELYGEFAGAADDAGVTAARGGPS